MNNINLFAYFFCSSPNLVEADSAIIQLENTIRSVCAEKGVEVAWVVRDLSTAPRRPSFSFFPGYDGADYKIGDIDITLAIRESESWTQGFNAMCDIITQLEQQKARLSEAIGHPFSMHWRMVLNGKNIPDIAAMNADERLPLEC